MSDRVKKIWEKYYPPADTNEIDREEAMNDVALLLSEIDRQQTRLEAAEAFCEAADKLCHIVNTKQDLKELFVCIEYLEAVTKHNQALDKWRKVKEKK